LDLLALGFESFESILDLNKARLSRCLFMCERT
jgi:hypothetical protein